MQRRRQALGQRIAGWWSDWRNARQAARELQGIDRAELESIASDLNLTVPELNAVARQGGAAADLLYRRMESLGLDAGDIARRAAAALRDLQRICTMCGAKGRCAHDLARGGGAAWRDYCANVETLDALVQAGEVRPSFAPEPASRPAAH